MPVTLKQLYKLKSGNQKVAVPQPKLDVVVNRRCKPIEILPPSYGLPINVNLHRIPKMVDLLGRFPSPHSYLKEPNNMGTGPVKLCSNFFQISIVLWRNRSCLYSRLSLDHGFAKKNSLSAPPNGWELLATSFSWDHLVTLQIGLKQLKFDTLVEEVYQVSDPKHPRYWQHLLQRSVHCYCAHPNLSSNRSHEISEVELVKPPFSSWWLARIALGWPPSCGSLSCERLGSYHRPYIKCWGHDSF
jgi:hypothetical protein